MISGLFSLPLTPLKEASSGDVRAENGHAGEDAELFFAGPENLLVRAAVEAVTAEELPYNPIVLCGASGVGKTVLAGALATRRRDVLDLKNVISTGGTDFARALAHAIESDSVADLRTRHQRCDLLIIDELHRLATKPAAQQLFLHTLDTLLRRGKLVIATLRHLPQATEGLLPGLASRLASGLVVPLAPPGERAREELIRLHAALLEMKLSDDSIAEIAAGRGPMRSHLTAPRLRHALLQLSATAKANQRPVRPVHVTRLLAEEAPELKAVVRQVTAAVARHAQVPAGELKGKSRQQAIADARGLAMYIIRKLTQASYAQIGSHFGDRDHSTVLHACRKYDRLTKQDDATRRTVDELTTQIAASEVMMKGAP